MERLTCKALLLPWGSPFQALCWLPAETERWLWGSSWLSPVTCGRDDAEGGASAPPTSRSPGTSPAGPFLRRGRGLFVLVGNADLILARALLTFGSVRVRLFLKETATWAGVLLAVMGLPPLCPPVPTVPEGPPEAFNFLVVQKKVFRGPEKAGDLPRVTLRVVEGPGP